LAIMVSTTTTHPEFAAPFESLFRSDGPIYMDPTYDPELGYRWKVATRLDNSFAFILPDQKSPHPHYRSRCEFLAWLAGFIDSDGSIGIIHEKRYARTNIQIANEDVELLRYIKKELLKNGFHFGGPYRTYPKGHVTQSRKIRYNEEMYYLTLQRYGEVKKILQLLPLKHEEKRQRRDLVLSSRKPLLWETMGSKVESLRKGISNDVDGYVRLAEVTYNKRSHKKRRESPTSRLSLAWHPHLTS